MTTKAELKKQIEALQAQYDAIPDEPVRLFEVAEFDEDYWIINEKLQVSRITYRNDSFDRYCIEIGNHFPDKAEAERMAAFIRKNFLYWRMALRFADGYEWEKNKLNHYVYENLDDFFVAFFQFAKNHGVIYMSAENVNRFAEFCNEHKEELGL